MQTIGNLLLAILLILLLGAASLVASIAVAIGISKVAGVNPYDGYWMYGILAAPVTFFFALLPTLKLLRRCDMRKQTTRGFDVVRRK